MRIEVTMMAGEPQEPALAYSKVFYLPVPPPDSAPESHLMDVTSALVTAGEEGLESVKAQASGLGAWTPEAGG